MQGQSKDAERHKDFFEIKRDLKSADWRSITHNDAGQFKRDVAQIDFTSQASTAIQVERDCVERALAFLEELLKPSAGDNEKEIENYVDTVFLKSMEFLKSLVSNDQDLAQKLNITIRWNSAKENRDLRTAVKKGLAKLAKALPDWNNLGEIKVLAGKGSKADCDILISAEKDHDHEKTAIPLSAFLGPSMEASLFRYDVAEKAVVTLVAFYLFIRFIQRDRYVFALAPCENSPALQFQQPNYWLNEILNDG